MGTKFMLRCTWNGVEERGEAGRYFSPWWPVPKYSRWPSLINTVNEPGEGVLFYSRAWIFKPFKEPRSRFPAWRASTITLFDVPDRPPGCMGWRNGFLGFSNVYRFGLSAGIFKQPMGAGNRVGIGLSYRPARLNRLAEFIPWNRFLGSINV